VETTATTSGAPCTVTVMRADICRSGQGDASEYTGHPPRITVRPATPEPATAGRDADGDPPAVIAGEDGFEEGVSAGAEGAVWGADPGAAAGPAEQPASTTVASASAGSSDVERISASTLPKPGPVGTATGATTRTTMVNW